MSYRHRIPLYQPAFEVNTMTDAVIDAYKAMSSKEQAIVDKLAEQLEFEIKVRNRSNPDLVVKPYFSKTMAIELLGKLGMFIQHNGKQQLADSPTPLKGHTR